MHLANWSCFIIRRDELNIKVKILKSIDKSELENDILRLVENWRKDSITSIETDFSTRAISTKHDYYIMYSCLVIST